MKGKEGERRERKARAHLCAFLLTDQEAPGRKSGLRPRRQSATKDSSLRGLRRGVESHWRRKQLPPKKMGCLPASSNPHHARNLFQFALTRLARQEPAELWSMDDTSIMAPTKTISLFEKVHRALKYGRKNTYSGEVLLGPSLGVSGLHDVVADGAVDLLGCRREGKGE